MRNSKLWITTFVLAMALGIVMPLLAPQEAQALYCPCGGPGIQVTSEPCQCSDGDWGVRVIAWEGYMDDCSTRCGIFSYCSACPPRIRKGPVPMEEPVDPENP